MEKKTAYDTLHESLVTVAKLIAPLTPFHAEKIYLTLGGQKESIHFEPYPSPEMSLIDPELVFKMDNLKTGARGPLVVGAAGLFPPIVFRRRMVFGCRGFAPSCICSTCQQGCQYGSANNFSNGLFYFHFHLLVAGKHPASVVDPDVCQFLQAYKAPTGNKNLPIGQSGITRLSKVHYIDFTF